VEKDSQERSNIHPTRPLAELGRVENGITVKARWGKGEISWLLQIEQPPRLKKERFSRGGRFPTFKTANIGEQPKETMRWGFGVEEIKRYRETNKGLRGRFLEAMDHR